MPRIRDRKDLECTWRFEEQAYSRGWRYVAGCDEAGRGALLGPLYAAAVILDPSQPIPGLNDSKKLSPQCREALALEIRAKAVSFQVVAVSAQEVDAVNVYQASRLAMIRALERLKPAPHFILTDAMPLWNASDTPTPFCGLIHGDARSVSIAPAASIESPSSQSGIVSFHSSTTPQGLVSDLSHLESNVKNSWPPLISSVGPPQHA